MIQFFANRDVVSGTRTLLQIQITLFPCEAQNAQGGLIFILSVKVSMDSFFFSKNDET